MRKGFPESYDRDALLAFLAAVKAGERGLRVPVYSHEDYDVLDEYQVLDAADVVIVEGLHLLALSDAIDIGIYVDAAEADIEQWFVDRFLLLRSSGHSFYRQFAGFSDDQATSFARQVWDVDQPGEPPRVHPADPRARRRRDREGPRSLHEADPPSAWKHDGVNDQELVDLLEEVWTSIETMGEDLREQRVEAPYRASGVDGPGQSGPSLRHRVDEPRAPVARPRGHRPRAREERHRTLERARGRLAPRLVGRAGAGGVPRAHHRAHREAPRPRRSRLRRRLVDADGPGHRAHLLPFRIFDSWVHEQDMRRAVGREGNLASGSALCTQNQMIDAMPFVIGKKVAPPDGSTVVFSVTGALPREFAILVLDRRAALFDEIPADPTVRLTLDWVTFERLACGRVDPMLCVEANEVRIDGDHDLGRRIVSEMNYMF